MRVRPAVERAATLLLLTGLLAAGLLVDSKAESTFDAPKRAAAIVAVAAAAALIAAFLEAGRVRDAWRSGSVAARISIASFAAGFAGVAISALLSPRAASSIATARGTLVLALAAPLAAVLFDERSMRRFLLCFVALATINSVASLMQRTGRWSPWAIERISGRTESIGMFGNEGLVALAAALGAVIAAAFWLEARGGARVLLASAFALNVAVIAASASLTPMIAAGAGIVVLVACRATGRRAAMAAACLVLAGSLAIAFVPQLRARAGEARTLVAAGDLDALTSYRVGAWAAAWEMIAARPVAGFGPGTFGAEFATHRIAAESRWGRRLAHPAGAGFEAAHCDYLQIAAESGVVSALCAALSIGLAALVLFRAARADKADTRAEPTTLLAVAMAIGVSALTWFPMQRPATALLALVILGRTWTIASPARQEHE